MIKYDINQAIIYDLPDEEASHTFANQLASCLKAPLTIAFSGDIGAGKTTIIRRMLQQLGITSAIKSPTFSLVESYVCNDMAIHHFDLYRIHSEDELEYIGFRDYFSPHSICCVEWAERAGKGLPAIDIRFKLSIKGAGREVQGTALSTAGTEILACLAGAK